MNSKQITPEQEELEKEFKTEKPVFKEGKSAAPLEKLKADPHVVISKPLWDIKELINQIRQIDPKMVQNVEDLNKAIKAYAKSMEDVEAKFIDETVQATTEYSELAGTMNKKLNDLEKVSDEIDKCVKIYVDSHKVLEEFTDKTLQELYQSAYRSKVAPKLRTRIERYATLLGMTLYTR